MLKRNNILYNFSSQTTSANNKLKKMLQVVSNFLTTQVYGGLQVFHICIAVFVFYVSVKGVFGGGGGPVVEASHILVQTVEDCETVKKQILKGTMTFEQAAMKYSRLFIVVVAIIISTIMTIVI